MYDLLKGGGDGVTEKEETDSGVPVGVGVAQQVEHCLARQSPGQHI